MYVRGEWFGIVNGQILSIFDSYLSVTHLYFCFQTITLVNVSGFSPNLVCALILQRSDLGLLMGKFRQSLIELSAHHTIVSHFYLFCCRSMPTRKKCFVSLDSFEPGA